MRPALACLVVIVLAVAAAGCGGEGDGDEDRIRAIIAEVAADPGAICAHLPAEVVDAIGGVDQCDALAVQDAAGDPASLEVDAVEVDGDTAAATVTSAGKPTEEIAFMREGDDWKVDDAAGG